MRTIELPDVIDPSEVCGNEHCRHTWEEHVNLGGAVLCRGIDKTHPQGVCGCEMFDDRQLIARWAQAAILKELLGGEHRYDLRDFSDVESWATHRLWEIGY